MLSDNRSAQPRALFLDRDGVINVNHGYVHSIENFNFIDGIFDLVQTAHANNLKVVVITNQAGIGRGFYSEQQFDQLTSWMCKEFMKQGAPIDKVYFSPFHPTEGLGKYKKDDFSRKAKSGNDFTGSTGVRFGSRKFDLDWRQRQ